MPNARDPEELLLRNLLDAGCGRSLTEACLRHFRKGTLPQMLPELEAHRRRILSEVRAGQRQIDCLDYLTNQIDRNQKGGE